MSEGSSMDRDDLPTWSGVEAVRAWTGLGASGPLGAVGDGRTHDEGRIVLPGPVKEAAREAEESTHTREGRHAEGRARIVRAIGGALGTSHAVGSGPWAPSMWRRPSSDGADEVACGEARSG